MTELVSQKNDNVDWTGLKVIDEEPNKNSEPVDDWLHDKFYETYWDWKKIRGDKKWKLDTHTFYSASTFVVY